VQHSFLKLGQYSTGPFPAVALLLGAEPSDDASNAAARESHARDGWEGGSVGDGWEAALELALPHLLPHQPALPPPTGVCLGRRGPVHHIRYLPPLPVCPTVMYCPTPSGSCTYSNLHMPYG